MINIKSIWMLISRLYVFYESIINLIGVAWFGKHLSIDVMYVGSITAAAGILVVLVPCSIKKDSKVIQSLVMLAGIVAVVGQIYLTIGNYRLNGEIPIGDIMEVAVFAITVTILIEEVGVFKRKFNNNKGG